MGVAKTTTAGWRSAKAAPSSPVDVAAVRVFVEAHLPGAEVVEKFGNASFSVAGKVFAFTRPDGLVMKLPQDVLASVLAGREAQHLVMGKRVMREWVVLALGSREGYSDELPLLKAAIDFVRSLETK